MASESKSFLRQIYPEEEEAETAEVE